MPGVQSVSLASSVPITSFPSRQKVYVEGQVSSADQQPSSILFNRVDPDYFKTMRIPILLGREFSDSDSQTVPLVAIVNHTMAGSFWPGQEPIGKRFSIGDTSSHSSRSLELHVTVSTRPLPRIRSLTIMFPSPRTTRHSRCYKSALP